ncbi:hypothetical protein KRX51_01205 [Corynebacterium sp. TAE3-ERU12]|uniref:hypothetical protein n=1 Tax=Corynebacterium sp. TAE3-ERU12 TaxID=2849491 RepID=UPI001C46D75D|nr:hypothetical protein [Corynebacterium sp. TAE3-ERU12]MBV7294536.1 hypothetical protein [Corynebacterium sp. TAE3-ERU12]
MSEEKLTVAELMARAGKEPAADRPRRRRRSLEEGGVSVADLTGSQRRVDAPGPRRGAHAADDPATTEAPSDDKAPAAPKAESKPEVKPAAKAGSKPAPKPEPKSAPKPEPEVKAATKPAPKAAAKPEPKPKPAPEPKPAPKPEAKAAAPAATKFASAFNVPAAVPANPIVIDTNPDDDEITLALTAFNDAKDGTTPVAEPGYTVKDILGLQQPKQPQPAAKPKVTPPGEANTDIQPAIPDEDAPQEPKDTKQPAAEKPEADKPKAGAAATGAAAAGAGAVAASAAAAKTTESVEPRSSHADTTATAEVPGMADEVNRAAPQPADDDVDDHGADDHVDDDRAEYVEPVELDEEEQEDNSLSIALLVIQVIVGLVAGAFLFVAFTWAWAQMPTIAAGVAALAVTVVMVLIANTVRRKRDKLTPILAGVVGLLLTFGPYLLMLR